jgi:hypothetical protein
MSLAPPVAAGAAAGAAMLELLLQLCQHLVFSLLVLLRCYWSTLAYSSCLPGLASLVDHLYVLPYLLDGSSYSNDLHHMLHRLLTLQTFLALLLQQLRLAS